MLLLLGTPHESRNKIRELKYLISVCDADKLILSEDVFAVVVIIIVSVI